MTPAWQAPPQGQGYPPQPYPAPPGPQAFPPVYPNAPYQPAPGAGMQPPRIPSGMPLQQPMMQPQPPMMLPQPPYPPQPPPMMRPPVPQQPMPPLMPQQPVVAPYPMPQMPGQPTFMNPQAAPPVQMPPARPAVPARPVTPPSFSVPPMPIPKRKEAAPVYQPPAAAVPAPQAPPAAEPKTSAPEDDLRSLRASLVSQAPIAGVPPAAPAWGVRKSDGTVAPPPSRVKVPVNGKREERGRLAALNPPQRAAVTADDGPLLIFAGAGSGKTRVLTHRIAWLIQQGRAQPHEVLAVTFTNKAAREMRSRVEQLLNLAAGSIWMGTFHAIAARILRRDGSPAGIDRRFVIYDEGDRLSAIKQVMNEMRLDPKRYPPGSVVEAISRAKDELLSPTAQASAAGTHFEEPDAKIVKLEQNYRSTQRILDAAYHVIKVNPNRADKRLWTDRQGGPKVVVAQTYDEQEEALAVAQEALRLVGDGDYRLGDIAVLYRTNAQSRALEEVLIRRGLPYRLIGGPRFYERREVKDVLAYLRLIANPQDTLAFSRVINVPRRKLGEKSLAQLGFFADAQGLTPWEALSRVGEITELASSAARS